jgi:hypothetical protein
MGLVVHEQAVVYPSPNLPRMEDVQNIPTRLPDAFERDGLEALKAGEDLFFRGAGDKARMLGSIRATRDCVACHGGTRGDLLGAFTYTLVRKPGKAN